MAAEPQRLPSAKPLPKVETPLTLTWWGHAAFKLESGGKTVLIDPWISGNSQCPIKVDDVKIVDIILVTHGHFDHLGDTMTIAKATGATAVAIVETMAKLRQDGLPDENSFRMHIGGSADIGGIRITMTEALHSSPTGSPTGYIIKFPGGATIYHAGDTGIFANMAVLASLYPIHIALLPIGDRLTMGAYQAANALTLLRPAKVIPMHFGTWPILQPNANEFVSLAREITPKVEVIVLKPGESYTLEKDTS